MPSIKYFAEVDKILIKLIFLLGPPKDFCIDKTDGGYANPSKKRQFFYCQNHMPSQCLWCAPMLIFNQECDRCLYLGQGKPYLMKKHRR